jgi:hypothetical protein
MLTITIRIPLNKEFPKEMYFCKSEPSFEVPSKINEV